MPKAIPYFAIRMSNREKTLYWLRTMMSLNHNNVGRLPLPSFLGQSQPGGG